MDFEQSRGENLLQDFMGLCSQLRGSGMGNVNAPIIAYAMGLQCFADVLDGLRKAAADSGNGQLDRKSVV